MPRIDRRRLLQAFGRRRSWRRHRRPRRHPRLGPGAGLCPGHEPALAAVGRFRAGFRPAAQGQDQGGVPEGARHQAHARDHQRQRHPGAHHLGDPVRHRPRHLHGAQQLAAALRRQPAPMSATSPRSSARRRAAFTTSARSSRRSAASGSACPGAIGGGLVAYRKSWLAEVGVDDKFPEPGTNTAPPARS